MSDGMNKVLRGVVKDHRLPSDYKHHWAQPVYSRAFLSNLRRFLMNRYLTKQNVALSAVFVFAYLPLYSLFNIGVHKMRTGHWPQAFQPQVWLHREGHYAVQHVANANPDNFWDRRFFCWTSDPNCGVDIGPKRPAEDLKNPEKVLVKFQRDADESQGRRRNGYRGM